jgi:sulfite reductase (NADPH) flavoprotein alpha-component
MTQPLVPPAVMLVPETAPFTPEQRSWLNGFLAGLVSLDGSGVTALSPEQSAALMPGAPAGPLDDGDAGDAPWHDQTLPMPERMKLAESRPLRRRMMAAMAQQDCGQCGYNCEDYSNALFLKKEERLNLCVPGGKETDGARHAGRRGARSRDIRPAEGGGRPLARLPRRGEVYRP